MIFFVYIVAIYRTPSSYGHNFSGFSVLSFAPECWSYSKPGGAKYKLTFEHLKSPAMTKQIIAVLVSAVLLFVWQFLSWSMLGVHQSEFKYTPNQDKILQALSENLPEEGTYMLPSVPPGTDFEQEQSIMQNYIGKPWAQVSYHKAFDVSMGMNMLRGFAIDAISAFLLIWLLMKMETRTMSTILTSSLAVGLIGYFTIPYLNSIWFETKSLGYLIDSVAQWGLVGVWLGWYLQRK